MTLWRATTFRKQLFFLLLVPSFVCFFGATAHAAYQDPHPTGSPAPPAGYPSFNHNAQNVGEQDAINRCFGYAPYNTTAMKDLYEGKAQGAIWVSNSGSSYYNGVVNVNGSPDNPYLAAIPVSIRGSIYDCSYPFSYSEYYAVKVSAPSTTTSGAANRLTIPYKSGTLGNYFSRGTRPNSTGTYIWSTEGESLGGTLKVSGIAVPPGQTTVTVKVSVYRCFGYKSGLSIFNGGSCFAQDIPVVIHWSIPGPRPPTGTLTATCVRNALNNIVYTVNGSYTDLDGSSSSPEKGFLSTRDAATGTYVNIASSTAPSPYKTGTLTWTSSAWPSGNIYLRAYEVKSWGTYTGPNVIKTVTRPACPPPLTTPTCSDFAVVASTQNSNSPQPNETYLVKVSFGASSAAAATTLANDAYTLTIGGVSHAATSKTASGTTVTIVFDGLTASAATGTSYFTFKDAGPAQVYAVPASGTDPNCAVQVGNKPYVQVFSGDVQAGVSVPTTPDNGQCTDPNSDGDISSWNNDAAGGFAGAGGKFGAEALGIIEGFVSAQGASPTGAGLSFANTVGVGGDIYGGSFNSDDPCMTLPTATTTSASSVTLGAASGITGHTVQYVNGDVYITGDRTYASGWGGSIKNIPSVMVVAVGGNIYIAPGVHELDGMYIAEVDNAGNGGTIYTCAPGGTQPNPDSTTLFGSCNNSQLVVNGSLIGNQVDLLRACGSVNQATTGDADVFMGGGLANCSASNHAAEVFNYGPTDWIGQSSLSSNTTTWDSVVSLPPVL